MENKSELADALLHIVTLCGYSSLDENQIDVLVRYINKDEPTLTGLKLKEMFDLAIKDKLGIELKRVLSVKEYFRVKFAWEKIFKIEQEIEKSKEPTQEQKDKFRREWLEYVYRQIENFFKTSDYKLMDTGNPLYNYLERAGLINFSKEVEEKFRLQIADNTKISSSTETRPVKMIIDQSDRLTKQKYKHYALEQFLRTCKQENRDIVGEIKSHEQRQEYSESEQSFK